MEVGEKINHLTLIEKHEGVKSLFKCDCGNEKMINLYNVKIGKTKSCGCLFKEHPNHTKHGDRWTRLYRIWRGMRERCNTPSCSTYKNYGARGITVCDEWNNYETFKKWALKNGYNDKLTIDRVNVNGNYEPSNCQWTTYKRQANNTRNNRILTAFGRTMTMTQWAEEVGIKASTLWARLDRGWSVEKALAEPLQK